MASLTFLSNLVFSPRRILSYPMATTRRFIYLYPGRLAVKNLRKQRARVNRMACQSLLFGATRLCNNIAAILLVLATGPHWLLHSVLIYGDEISQ